MPGGAGAGDVGAGSAPVPGAGVSVPGGACARGCGCPEVPVPAVPVPVPGDAGGGGAAVPVLPVPGGARLAPIKGASFRESRGVVCWY